MSASQDLARRAVACKGWRRMSGMLGADGWRVFDVGILDDGAAWADLVEVSSGDQRFHIGEWLPDLDDPATLGCLLALVREAWGCDEWRRLTVEPAGKGWCIIVRNARHRPPSRAQGGGDLDPIAPPRYMNAAGPFGANEFDSEAEALVAALEAAP